MQRARLKAHARAQIARENDRLRAVLGFLQKLYLLLILFLVWNSCVLIVGEFQWKYKSTPKLLESICFVSCQTTISMCPISDSLEDRDHKRTCVSCTNQ